MRFSFLFPYLFHIIFMCLYIYKYIYDFIISTSPFASCSLGLNRLQRLLEEPTDKAEQLHGIVAAAPRPLIIISWSFLRASTSSGPAQKEEEEDGEEEEEEKLLLR